MITAVILCRAAAAADIEEQERRSSIGSKPRGAERADGIEKTNITEPSVGFEIPPGDIGAEEVRHIETFVHSYTLSLSLSLTHTHIHRLIKMKLLLEHFRWRSTNKYLRRVRRWSKGWQWKAVQRLHLKKMKLFYGEHS